VTLRNAPQLITYPDSLGGSLAAIGRLLDGPLDGAFGGIHILPPFPSTGDRGFAPVTYREIDPRFGSWADVRRLAERLDVELDLMVNHVSRRSDEFGTFLRDGPGTPAADVFVTLDKVWPDGRPRPEDVARIFLRRASPFSTYPLARGGSVTVWTTFGRDDRSEQVDIDVRSDAGRALIERDLRFLSEQGVRIVRLDALGYVVKKAGTSCFMVEPEIYDVVDWLVDLGGRLGLEILAEVHDVMSVQERLVSHGAWVYDFVLPGLVLHALRSGSPTKLAAHLRATPRRGFTMLDCHDGIPIQPDLDTVLDVGEARAIVDVGLAAGGNVSTILSAAHLRDPGFDAHQLNVTYRAAVGDDDAYLAARAIQLFAPGIPQVYYVGLLGGENDQAAVERTGDGRAVNRHDFTGSEIETALERPLVRRQLELLRLRASHPAFGGAFEVAEPSSHEVRLTWRAGEASLLLDVDLAARRATLTATGPGRPFGPRELTVAEPLGDT
jgi:sucrose 6(F)-phosphate phosphorylase